MSTQLLNGKIKSAKFQRCVEFGGLELTLEIEGKGWGTIVSSPAFTYYTREEDLKVNSEAVANFHRLLEFFNVRTVEDLVNKIVTCEFSEYNTFKRFRDILDNDIIFEW